MIINKEILKQIINDSIDEIQKENTASNIATTAKDTLGGAAGSLAKNPMIDKFVQVASERFAKRPLTDKVSFIVRLMEIFGVDDGVLVRVRNDMKKMQQQAKTSQQAPTQSATATPVKEECGPMQPVDDHSCADDHEASMAKSDLFKLANYAVDLQTMIDEGEELEGWVQAKITKAADYISSVKHYLEYEKVKGHE